MNKGFAILVLVLMASMLVPTALADTSSDTNVSGEVLTTPEEPLINNLPAPMRLMASTAIVLGLIVLALGFFASDIDPFKMIAIVVALVIGAIILATVLF